MQMQDAESGPQAARSRRLQRQMHMQERQQEHAVDAAAAAASITAPLETRFGLSAADCAPTAPCHLRIAKLQEERAFLSKYVERLLQQLRRVLDKHGELAQLKTIADAEVPREDAGDSELERDVLPPWGTARQVTVPLLQAYDAQIADLEQAVRDGKKTIEQTVARAEALAKENSTLREELEAASEKLMLRMQHEPNETRRLGDDVMLTHAGDSTYMGDIHERLDVLMSENALLMEQMALQDEEMNGLRKEVEERDQQVAVMGQNFNQATVAVQELREAAEVLRGEKQHCEQQLQQYAIQLAQMEGEQETTVSQCNDLRSACKAREAQLAEFEVLVESLKKNAERKEETMITRYQNVCSRLRELGSALNEKEAHIEQLEEQNRQVATELDLVRQDCEGMLQVLTSMEKQLSQYSTREDAVAELEAECKAKMEDMVIENEQISARETQARREIARLLEKIRAFNANEVAELEEASHRSIGRHENDLRVRDEELNEAHSEMAQLRVKMEAAARNQRDAEKTVVEAMKRVRDAEDMLEKKIKEIGNRAAAAEESKDQVSRSEEDARSALNLRDQELAKVRTECRERIQELTEKIACLERELEVRRTEIREAREEGEEKNLKLQLLNEELTKVKAECAARVASELEGFRSANIDLKARCGELEYRLSEMKKDMATAVESAQHDKERIEVRALAEAESLRLRLTAFKEEKVRADKARQEAEASLSTQLTAVQRLTRELADAKEALIDRERACEDSDRKIAEMSAQATLALSKQQQFFRQEREMRASVERLTLEKTRLEREATMCRKKLEESRHTDYFTLPPSTFRMETTGHYTSFEKNVRAADTSVDSDRTSPRPM